ncbi:MAG: glycosyltransferase [Thaumarchaeota archaeon]|nr:glycosyltransferase [Nitrososphaerota archaeon]
MKVSIVIPVYNASKYIDECVLSALGQTYKDIEIIAVDDGSKDDSLERLGKYEDKIKIISKKNGGTPTALNAAIRVMTGEWFKWLSADDLLERNAIEVLVGEVEKLGDKSSSHILYSNYSLIDKDGKMVGEFVEPDYNGLDEFERNVVLLDHYYGNGTTSLIPKSIFDRFGLFDEGIGFQEDYEFWLRCCIFHDCRLHLVPQKLARYRIHEGQLTKTKINEALEHASSIRSLILNRLPEDKRKLYVTALKRYQRNKPVATRLRRQIRDIMIHVLPKSVSSSIIKSYVNRKRVS